MNDSGPTYASLTPANPTIINGLASVDLQTGHLSSQSVYDTNDTLLSSSLSMPVSNTGSPLPLNALSVEPKSEVKIEENNSLGALDRNTLNAVLQFLRKNNLKGTEDILRRESNYFDAIEDSRSTLSGENEVSNVFCSYKTEGNANEYDDAYRSLINFVEKTLDSYKHELSLLLFPIFVHMYLELIYNGHDEIAKGFLRQFGVIQERYYQQDVHRLSLITTRDQMHGYQLLENFHSGLYTIRMSKDTHAHLKRLMTENAGTVMPRIIQARLYLDIYEGVPRSKSQIKTITGAQEGEATRVVNKAKVYYGLLKEPELQNILMEEEEGEEEGDKPKKKKTKKENLQKSKKNDPNAPANDRVPLPELRDIDKVDKAKAYRDCLKRVLLNRETLPSICFYSFMNAIGSVTAVDVSDDSSLLAIGLLNSNIKVQSISPSKLRCMKPADQLSDIVKDADDVIVRMMDERSAESCKTLIGHSGPVYSCSFSPDKNLLLTCGEDTTIHLWSLQTWTCLLTYKGHLFAVWDVKFSPIGYYFASGGHDRTARLWATDHQQPLRIFAGHFSDVDVVQFHPNCNYIASGSSDRSVRMWDCTNGDCVRVLTGHKSGVQALSFSPCGRFLSSAGSDGCILIWDISNGHQIAEMFSHTATIYTLSFSRDGNILASGGLDNCVKLWDFLRIMEELNEDELNTHNNPDVKRSGESLLVTTFPTKCTPVMLTHFTRRNVLLAAGPYEAGSIT